jgi:hypothetical protein
VERPIRVAGAHDQADGTETCEIMASRDSEEVRLLPIMKAAGIKPE